MVLKPQDLYLTLYLLRLHATTTYARISKQVGLSISEAHAAHQRARTAQLLRIVPEQEVAARRRQGRPTAELRVNRNALLELVLHGARYVFVPDRGPVTRGTPTLSAASPLAERFAETDRPSVWPDPRGEARGESFSPLYRAAPAAARRDPHFYETLVLVDAIRGGNARERKIAGELFTKLCHEPAPR